MGAGLLMAGFPPIPGTSGAVLPASPTNVPRIGDFGHAPGGTSIQDVNGRFIRGGFGFTWEGLDAVLGLPLRFQEYITKAVAATAADIAEEMQAYAQENAPWEDRTGDARSGLKAVKVEDRATDSFYISRAQRQLRDLPRDLQRRSASDRQADRRALRSAGHGSRARAHTEGLTCLL
jgi:hypothetical protein